MKLRDDSMVKDGETIAFQRVFLVDPDRTPSDLSGVLLGEEATPSKRARAGKGPRTERKTKKKSPRAAKATRAATKSTSKKAVALETSDDLGLALRGFRSAEAKRLGVPAFRIFTDRTLAALASERPADEEELLAIGGVGQALVKRYGKAILALIRG